MTKQEDKDALDELVRLFAEDDSLHDDGFTESLPPLPPLPEAPDEVLAIFIPRKPKPRIVRGKKPGPGAS